MRILVISQFYPPDITAAAFRISDVVRQLAREGHDVAVLTATPHKVQVAGADEPEVDARVQVRRCDVAPVVGSGATAYLRHYFSYVRGSIGQGIRLWLGGWRPDVIYASSPPLFVGLTARFLSFLWRAPVVFEVRDIWPDTAVAAGQISGGGRAYAIGRRLERYLYRKARHITCVSRPMQAYIESQTTTPCTVVYNGVPADQVALGEGSRPAAAAAGAPRTILYAGNMGHLQELDLLIQGFVELSREGVLPGWQLRLIGAGAQKDALEAQVRELEAGEVVRIEPPVAREAVAEELRGARLLYLNLKRNPTLEKTIPSKVFDYLLAARPVVAGLAGEGREILEYTGANVCFDPGDLRGMKEAFLGARDRYAELDAHASGNRELVLEKFTRERGTEDLMKIFEDVR